MESKVKISVFDHAFSSPLFTWSNRQLDGFLARKLDRVLINGNWLPCFAQSQVEFLPPEISDHCPALIQLQQDNYSPPKPFKFFNYWTKHGKFLEIVEQSWNEAVLGDPMSRLHQKMKRLKAKLKEFNQDEFGNVTHKVTEKRKNLADIQTLVLNNPLDKNLIEMEGKLSLELNALLQAEESYYKQKSRISWIREGDQNTKFFQKIVAAQTSRSSITVLNDATGNKLTSFSQISGEAVNFFQNLLGVGDANVTGCSTELLAELLQVKLSTEAIANLCKIVTSEEIKVTMNEINGDKASRPDGYTSQFFKTAWRIIGEDVIKAIKYFFATRKLLPAFNATTVALVPKCPNPCRLKISGQLPVVLLYISA